MLHDFGQVRQHFPQTLLLSREAVAIGPTTEVLTEANISQALRLHEAFEQHAPVCEQRDGATA